MGECVCMCDGACMHTCMCVCVCRVCTSVRMLVCVCLCLCVHVCVCVHMIDRADSGFRDQLGGDCLICDLGLNLVLFVEMGNK